jgi:hypothetical protein
MISFGNIRVPYGTDDNPDSAGSGIMARGVSNTVYDPYEGVVLQTPLPVVEDAEPGAGDWAAWMSKMQFDYDGKLVPRRGLFGCAGCRPSNLGASQVTAQQAGQQLQQMYIDLQLQAKPLIQSGSCTARKLHNDAVNAYLAFGRALLAQLIPKGVYPTLVLYNTDGSPQLNSDGTVKARVVTEVTGLPQGTIFTGVDKCLAGVPLNDLAGTDGYEALGVSGGEIIAMSPAILAALGCGAAFVVSAGIAAPLCLGFLSAGIIGTGAAILLEWPSTQQQTYATAMGKVQARLDFEAQAKAAGMSPEQARKLWDESNPSAGLGVLGWIGVLALAGGIGVGGYLYYKRRQGGGGLSGYRRRRRLR